MDFEWNGLLGCFTCNDGDVRYDINEYEALHCVDSRDDFKLWIREDGRPMLTIVEEH